MATLTRSKGRALAIGLFASVILFAGWPAASLADEPEISTAAEAVRHFQTCVALPDSYRRTTCFEPYFRSLTKLRSATIAVAHARQLRNQGIIGDCHLIAHSVGEANLDKHGSDLGRALATCPTGCLQGCIHGVVQTYVGRKDDFEAFIAELDHVCDVVSNDAWLRRQCIHGVGHGFLTGGFLPLGDAIKACRGFAGEDEETCLSGVFMENMRHYLVRSEQELTEGLATICRDVARMNNPSHTRLCYESVGEGLMFFTGHDLGKSLGLCDGVANAHRDVCKWAAIVEARHAPTRFDVTACDLAPAKYRDRCADLLRDSTR